MSGPRTSSILLLFSIAFLQSTLLEAKPFSAMHGGGVVRHRRDLRDSLPYEAQMMSYPPADFKGRGNELYYQPEAVRAQGLGQALQRLMENDQRREQEAAYLSGLLRLLNEAENNGQGKQEEEEEEDEGDFQGPYPSDYDETEQTVSMAKPRALLDPQLAEALLNRYRQERLLQAGINPNSNRLPDREQDRDQEMLRYLVEKILSSLGPGNQPSQPSNRRAKRDVSAVSSSVRGGATPLRRSRRSVDSAPMPSPNSEASLLRVKRLGDESDDEGFAAQSSRAPHAGLQRMKRIDTDLPPPPKHSRKRRAVTYDPDLIAQHILQYLPA
ncbi:proprotein convertase subtilisin/kexin type 1 inhibitor, like [Astyanax mexicanus]|uniref:proprotein convertase subtilisin/kexin type 1 inhibitor, like n=1 Tax=Astyanax mexicanus TaxID=7994 RepID=UPI0020CAC43A|nr:proprotein convertase subtilisin/kexin type 1 inhibitor, like [Astyanax mexicanus]